MKSISFLEKWLHRIISKQPLSSAGNNPEQDLIAEIEQILSETKTKIPLVRNYRDTLKGPVLQALETIFAMISQIPGPLKLDPDLWKNDPALRTFFSGADEFTSWLAGCTNLHDAFARTQSAELFALLVGEHKEKTFFGVSASGDIVSRDVLKRSVYFENPRLLTPAPDLVSARKMLQHRLITVLFTRELEEITELKSVREELQKQQALLEFKLWGSFEKPSAVKEPADSEAEILLSDIDREIGKIGNDLDTPEGHLAHVTQALTNLKNHLHISRFTLRLDSLGIRQKASSQEPFDEITLAECTFTGAPRRAAIWIHVDRSALRRP